MVDYINATNIHMPQLELYSWVAKDLQAWIDNNKKTYREAEEEVSKVTPTDRKSTRLNSSHSGESRMPSSA